MNFYIWLLEIFFQLFLDYGYSKNQILKMTVLRPQLFCFETNLLISKMKYLEELLGNKKTVIKVTLDFPVIYSYDSNSIENKINSLVEIGYERENLIKNIKWSPELIGLSVQEKIKVMISELQRLGFTLTDVLKITSKNMTIFGRDIETIKKIIEKMESYGYEHSDVIAMIRKHPPIINYAFSRLDQRMEDMCTLIGDKEVVLYIMKTNPALFGDSMDKIIDKKMFYDSLGLVDIFIKAPKDMFQGISKSYARFKYFQSINIDIFAKENGYKLLFMGETIFKKRYKVETAELIKIYDVDEYMKEVKSKKRV